jgi:hypothetical protein
MHEIPCRRVQSSTLALRLLLLTSLLGFLSFAFLTLTLSALLGAC